MKNMKLKIILPVCSLLLSIISGGCGMKHDIAGANMPENADASAQIITSAEPSFAGNWYEPIAQHGYCTVTVEDEVCNFLISWRDSAASTYIWRFSGSPNKERIINYTNCVKELHSWNEKGEETVEPVEENGCGSIWLTEENRMAWLEHLTDQEPSEFVRE